MYNAIFCLGLRTKPHLIEMTVDYNDILCTGLIYHGLEMLYDVADIG